MVVEWVGRTKRNAAYVKLTRAIAQVSLPSIACIRVSVARHG
jgi:hypothetical protein